MTTISDLELDPLYIGIDPTSLGDQDAYLIPTHRAHEISLLDVSVCVSDSNSSYLSVEGQEGSIEGHSQPQPEEDLSLVSVPGMYCILDLIREHSASEPVDKVVVAQDSFWRFLDEISPGVCLSLTKVDFGALDKF
ncbi:hypothetical protein JVU11DRAFT_12472 [Chiua virens]|nr:hypothetical protein JVU11DRAFT_12472 [Chiua virens]